MMTDKTSTTTESAGSAKGLPMVAQWDPAKLQAEEAMLEDLASRPFTTRFRGYLKLTGPGWLQSAMTLGGGSAAASVVAAYGYGYDLLWVQPLAMIAGIIMLAAIGNAVLATGERPYGAIRREVHGSVALMWGLATLAASIIWHFPQYGLAAAAVADLAQGAGMSDASMMPIKWITGAVILGLAVVVTWSYGSHASGIRFYESAMRWAVRLIIAAFLIVVVVSAARGNIDYGAMARGFFAFRVPAGSIPVILGAFGAAVGVNMTFLYAYSLLAKGWGRRHTGLARADLTMSLFLPYVITTSLIIIAIASTRGQIATALDDPQKLTPITAAGAMQTVFGGAFGRIIFDLGLIGFAVTSITTHMVVCGFAACEIFKLDYTVARYRMFSLLPAIGVLGVAFKSPFWAPIVASAICLPMLLIAYAAFFVLNNKKSYMGDRLAVGTKRLAWNVAMLTAIALTVAGVAIQFNAGVIDKLFP